MFNHQDVFLPQLLYATDVYNLATIYNYPVAFTNISVVNPFSVYELNNAFKVVGFRGPEQLVNDERLMLQYPQQPISITDVSERNQLPNRRQRRRVQQQQQQTQQQQIQPRPQTHPRPQRQQQRRPHPRRFQKHTPQLANIPEYQNVKDFKANIPYNLLRNIESNRVNINVGEQPPPPVYITQKSKHKPLAENAQPRYNNM